MKKCKGSFCVIVMSLVLVGPAMAQGFGSAVAIGDGEVFVAEPLNEMDPGAVYVYQKNSSGSWVATVQLLSGDATDGDRFGRAIATDGNTLVVGATVADDTNGAAYIYQKDGAGRWVQTARVTASDGVPGDAFGRSAAIHDDLLLVSSWAHADAAGAVYVFQRGQDGTWAQSAKLIVESESGTPFGQMLATDGNRIIVGAPIQFGFRRGPQAGGDERRGQVYVFSSDGMGGWKQESELTVGDLPRGAGFGSAVAIDGDHAYVGAPGINSGGGAVFAFVRNPQSGAWSETGTLQPFDTSPRTQFGAAIAVNGSEVWVGTPGADGTGATYVFTKTEGGTWSSSAKVGGGEDLEPRDRFASTLAVRGNIAVAGVAGDDFGAGTAVILERRDGRWMAAQKIAGDVKGPEAVTGDQVDCTDGVAVAFDCNEVDMVAFLPVKDLGGSRGVRLNDVWGWTDAQTGREYAIVGRLDGTSFVDISDPNNPRYLGNLPKTEAARASTWRDMKVYRDHVFIVADGAGPHGMQVFDLTQLRNVRAPVTFSAIAHYDQIASAHNIVINEETGFAFSVGSSAGGETCGGGLHMINIQDPTNPTFAGCFADANTGRRGTGYSHDAQCVTYRGPDVEHAGKEICMGANETALSVADVTNKDEPVALAMASYPNVGYSHQGWLTEDHRYFYMNDELDELGGNVVGTRTLVWDVTDLDDPVLVKEHMSENLASDHNLYVRGDYMYQSNYQSGLRVLNVRDPENPVEVGFFDTVPYGEDTPGFGGSWSNYPFFESGVIIVTSGQEGLFLLKKRPQEIIP